MVSSVSVETSQADTSGVFEAEVEGLFTAQADLLAVFNIPSLSVETSQIDLNWVSTTGTDVETSQFDVLVIMTGRVDDPSIRAWTFTLDGHDFYVLRLGNNETLVYDLTTEQWSLWSTANELYWSLMTGTNWVGGNSFASVYGSNIIVGSDANGALFFLDPNKPDDDAAAAGRGAVPFRRRVTGQLATRGYNLTRVFELQLLGSIGELDFNSDLNIELLYSDDRGDSYVSAGVITTESNNYDIRASWRSLGSFPSPGRLFRIEDFGALKRIDSLTVNTSLQPKA